jgi:4-hydroxybenzoate polyprenyltransferase
LVVSGVALLAGGGAFTAVRLGVSMTALQFAIGALNDIVDAPADEGRVPPKPLPAGLVSRRAARMVVAGATLVGVALAIPGGPGLVALAVLVLAIGAAYDLVAKGTPWSWLPFAIGIPVLPVYGWFGATGTLPPFVATIVPMAAVAGAGLAVANARADLEADASAGTDSVARRLGADRSWWVGAFLMAAAIAVGIAALAQLEWNPGSWTLVGAGIGVIVAGLILGRFDDPGARRRGWEAQAIGAAIAATGWVAGIVPGAS